MDRRAELDEIFKDIDEKEKKLLSPTLDELVRLENDLEYYSTLPQLNVNPKNPAMQKRTEAARLRKECSQSYANYVRILCSILHKVDVSAEDELLKKLEEFT